MSAIPSTDRIAYSGLCETAGGLHTRAMVAYAHGLVPLAQRLEQVADLYLRHARNIARDQYPSDAQRRRIGTMYRGYYEEIMNEYRAAIPKD